jgi:hypothetical protein
MKDFKYYNDAGPYPHKSDFEKVFVYKSGEVLVYGLPVDNFTDEMRKQFKQDDAFITHELDREGFQAQKAAYQERTNELQEEFKRDLFEEFGVTNNPKADQLYGICFMRNHSGGYSDVMSIFSDFVDLIR